MEDIPSGSAGRTIDPMGGPEGVEMCKEAERTLTCEPRAVGLGRRFVADRLEAWGVVDGDGAYAAAGDILLVVSELLTNAVKACTSEVGLKLTTHRTSITVAVTDDSPQPAVPRHPGPDDVGGRGLGIVAALGQDWGQRSIGGGRKVVWCDVLVAGESALGLGCTLP